MVFALVAALIFVALMFFAYFFIDGLFWGSTFSSWARFLITLVVVAIFIKYRKTITRRRVVRWSLIAILVVFVGQWFLLGQVHTSDTFAYYNLRDGSTARLPIFGSYAKYDGEKIIVRRSYFSKEVTIDTEHNDPKAISLNLIGDRLVVRYHIAHNPMATGFGHRVFYDTKTAKLIGYSDFETGFWHSRLHLVF